MKALLRLTVNSILSLPGFLKLAVSGGKPVQVAGRTLDIDFQLLSAVEKNGVKLHTLDVKQARRHYDFLSGVLSSAAHSDQQIDDITVPGPASAIGVRRYIPPGAAAGAPAILYIHGGGNTIGSLDSHHGFCSDYARETGFRLYSVDYRLGPEARFPAAEDDCLAVYRWLLDQASDEQIDPGRIIVAGDSAGGRHCAVLSVDARDQGLTPPVGQVLIYPATHIGRDTKSFHDFGQGFMLTSDLIEYFDRHYINNEAEKENARLSVLKTKDLTGLPEAVVTVAGFDPLYDEGLAYAARLQEAGNRVKVLKHDSLGHGFVTMAGVLKAANAANHEIFAATRHLIQ